jgi:hypothetical protein
MHTISTKVITLALALSSVAPLFAEDVPLIIAVKNLNYKPVVATVTLTPSNGKPIVLDTEADGKVSAKFPRGTIYTCSVTSKGLAPLTFIRRIPASEYCEWVTARLIRYPPAAGRSYLTEYRCGYTRDAEQPTRDACRFNVWVRDFASSNGIDSAVISLYDANGNLVRSLSTDCNGFTSFLVRERVPLTVRVETPDHATYQTGVDPGLEATWRSLEMRLRRVIQ